MTEITYTPLSRMPFAIGVDLEGRRVGMIRMEKDGSGYFYAPKRGGRGETFECVSAVKQSLETA